MRFQSCPGCFEDRSPETGDRTGHNWKRGRKKVYGTKQTQAPGHIKFNFILKPWANQGWWGWWWRWRVADACLEKYFWYFSFFPHFCFGFFFLFIICVLCCFWVLDWVEKLEFLRVSAVAAFGRRRMPPSPPGTFPDTPSFPDSSQNLIYLYRVSTRSKQVAQASDKGLSFSWKLKKNYIH